MKLRWMSRIAAALLAAALLLTACTASPEAPKGEDGVSPLNDNEIVTGGTAVDYLLSAAARYSKSLPTRDELLESVPELQEFAPVTRLQALVLTGKVFGDLPEPKGNNARLAPADVDLSGIPDWAGETLKKLNAAGVLSQTDLEPPESEAAPSLETKGAAEEAQTDSVADQADGSDSAVQSSPKHESSSAGKSMSGKELKTVVRRIYALYGSELKDDFYAAVNKNALDTKEIPAGETDAGGTYDQRILVQNQVNSIIREIVEGSGYAPGSMEQKIKDFYESAVDFETRNRLGAEPLRSYIDAIDSAKNLQELSDAQVLSMREIGSGALLTVAYMPDFRDTSKVSSTLMAPIEPSEEVEDEHYIRLLTLIGESEEEAKAHIAARNRLLEALKPYAPKQEDYADLSKSTRYVTPEELQAMLPGLDVRAIIEAGGDELPKEFCLMGPTLFEGLGKLMQEGEYLDALKTELKLGLILSNYTYLSQDFLDAFDEYNQKTMGQAPSESTPEETAYAMVNNSLGEYIDQLYVERYFPPEAKQAVEEMVKQFIGVFQERIQKLDWMSAETKEAAIKKLSSMKFFIGYPDHWSGALDSVEITDNFFQNQVALAKRMNQRMREEAAAKNRGELENDMKLPASTVNAYYDQFSNTMCFPAGILQAPAFDVNASLEENLGGIGTTIAHEITHAFDNTGAKFDANGIQNDWWNAEDYKKFQELCERAEAFYDGWESGTGIPISGSQTLGENIADIGGVACALEVLRKTENPDYDKFFRAYAAGWLKCTTRARAESLAEVDEHGPNNLRVNRVLANFQEFYDTYRIQKGDGMYVAPEDRISIW